MVDWLDVQPFLRKVQHDLQPGQLIHGEHFSLFEAMCALEVGNPKTDAAAAVKPHMPGQPDDRASAVALLAPLDINHEQVMSIHDRLMASEVCWQRGHTLPQTVYSCLYLLYPERTEHVLPLQALCRAVAATCGCVSLLVERAQVCKEEDMLTQTFGLDLDRSAEEQAAAVALLQQAEQHLLRYQSSSSTEPEDGSSGGAGRGHSQPAASDAASQAVLSSLLTRVRLRRHLLQGLMALQALSPASVQEAHQHFSEAQSQLRSAQQQQQQQQQQTASASAPDPVLDALNPTPGIKQDLGIRQGLGSDAAPALDSRPEDLNLTPQIQVHQELGFDASINWSMLGPAPPRTVPHVSSTEAWAHTEQLLQDLLGTFDVLQVQTLRELQTLLEKFARGSPGVLARSVMRLLAVPPASTASSSASGKARSAKPTWGLQPEMLRGALGLPEQKPGTAAASEASPAATGRAARPEVQRFLQQAYTAVQERAQAMCLNHARRQRRLKRIGEQWGDLHALAVNADSAMELPETSHQPQQGPANQPPPGLFTAWVEREGARLAAGAILQGCELSLYEDPDYLMVFRYSAHLLACACESTSAMGAFLPAACRAWHEEATKLKGKKGAKKGSAKGQLQAGLTLAQEQLLMSTLEQTLEAERLRWACQAVSWMYQGLQLQCSFRPHPCRFNTQEHRFEQRFAFLQRLAKPEPLGYAPLLRDMDACPDAATAFSEAAQCFAAARGKARQHAQLHPQALMSPSLEQLLTRGHVAMTLMAQAGSSETSRPARKVQVTWDTAAHPFLPSISLKAA